MTQQTVSLRIATALIQRLDRLGEACKSDPRLSPKGRLTRADLLREAILRGCAELERQHGGQPALPPAGGNTGALTPWGGPSNLPMIRPDRLPVDDPSAPGDAMDAEFEPFT